MRRSEAQRAAVDRYPTPRGRKQLMINCIHCTDNATRLVGRDGSNGRILAAMCLDHSQRFMEAGHSQPRVILLPEGV